MRVIHADGRGLWELSNDDRQAWEHWLQAHQLEPDRIPVTADIYCNDDERWILATYYIRKDGHPVIDENGSPSRSLIMRRLESPALPCPPGYRVTEEPAYVSLTDAMDDDPTLDAIRRGEERAEREWLTEHGQPLPARLLPTSCRRHGHVIDRRLCEGEGRCAGCGQTDTQIEQSEQA